MNVKSVEKKEKSIVAITIEVSHEEFEADVNNAYKKQKSKISVPGFRKGKVPRKIVESMYGSMYFYQDAVEECCPRCAAEAAANEKLHIVGDFSYGDFDFPEDGSFVFTVNIPVYPEVTLGEYKGLTAYKAPVTVGDEEVEKELNTLRERNSRQVTVEREVANGDIVVLDFEGSLDGVPFAGGKGEQQNLTIGSGMFVPGFEEQLVGHKAGEEFTIDVTFPENYGNEELAGKLTQFAIKLHEVKEKQLPELDDEFAKDVSEHDTLEELKKFTLDKLTETAENESQRAFRNELLKLAASNMSADVPDAMYESRLDQVVDRYASDMQMQGIPFEQFLGYMNTTLEQFRERFRASAVDQVNLDLTLDKIAEVEGITATEEEIEKEYADIAESYRMDLEEVKMRVPQESIVTDIRYEKAAKLIEETGVATDVKPEEPSEEASAE